MISSFYVVIQQLESHILAPNIVGSSVGVHPLLVIFALLAGAQMGGILGMIASLPLLAMLKHSGDLLRFQDVEGALGRGRRHRADPGQVGGAAAAEGPATGCA